jgi:hypothetical protein
LLSRSMLAVRRLELCSLVEVTPRIVSTNIRIDRYGQVHRRHMN